MIGGGEFQFTLPRGERPRDEFGVAVSECFNSRSRGGSDICRRAAKTNPRGFNSRSRGGSDSAEAPKDDFRQCFNSRSRGGSDLPTLTNRLNCPRFNSRSRGGSDANSK